MLDDGQPVVIDFGIAHIQDSTRLTKTGLVMGTPGYLSPEVIEGKEASGASDVHSWGTTVAFAATGRQPYGTGDFQTVFYRVLAGRPELTGVPPELLPLVAAALSTDPLARPTARSLVSLCAASAANGTMLANGTTRTAKRHAADDARCRRRQRSRRCDPTSRAETQRRPRVPPHRTGRSTGRRPRPHRT